MISGTNSDKVGVIQDVVMCECGAFRLTCSALKLRNYVSSDVR